MRIVQLSSALLVLATASLTGCGDNEGGGRARGTASASPAGAASSVRASSEAFLLKTHVQGFDGRVLPGSVLGDARFCDRGLVHHAFGTPSVGFPAVNEITCSGSVLRIGFGPGPDQMNKRIQRSDWRVLDSTGDFAGATGSGQMRVEWDKVGGTDGRETFTGTVALP
jgi:hypothetical protein